MSRFVLFAALFAISFMARDAAHAQSKSDPGAEKFKLGAPFTSEITGEKVKVPGTNVMRFRALVPISLKAGQEISATVTVPGKDRIVGLLLLDPMRKPIGRYDPADKTAKLASTEVSAKGVYHIAVFSDAVGSFTLTATSRNSSDDEEKALVEKAKQLRKELDEVEAKLKAIREKK